MARRQSLVFLLLTLAGVVALDQLTKWWVVTSFALFEVRPVVAGVFNLTYVLNTGAAFGMLAGPQVWWRQLFFLLVAVVALAVLAGAYHHYRERGGAYVAAIGLIAGGAVGNFLDRLRLGAVVDFLDFYLKTHHWPAFNVADSAITVGVGLFLLASFRETVPADGSDE